MIVSRENAHEICSRIADQPLLALDTETTGLEERDVPFAAIFADGDETYYFDERVLPDTWDHVKLILERTQARILFQNAKFDMKMLMRKGINPWHRLLVTDIAVAARLHRNDHLAYNLDTQAQRILKRPKDARVTAYIKTHQLFEKRVDFFGEEYSQPMYQAVPVELMAEYAQTDARLTYDLYKHYVKELGGPSGRVLENESYLTPVCLKMERVGLQLNKAYTIKALYFEQELLTKYTEEFKNLTGAKYVNSAKSLQKVIKYELPQTAKGNPSLTEEGIEELLEQAQEPRDKEIVALVRLIRSYDKRISTYYKPYLNMAGADHVIHPTMWQAGTRTGRFSYSDPNLQNIPKEEGSTAPFVVRGCFMPRPGRKYFSFDYKQMEYFLAVAYAEETEIIAEINNGVDFHQATADMLGIKRSQAKTLNFACLYGAGPSTVAAMLGVSVREARQLLDTYFAKLPRIARLIQNVISTGESRGYVTNWFGRDLYADREFCYALPNHLIQSGGADVVKLAMVQIHQEFPSLMMVLQIHDQLVFELLPEEERHIPRIIEIMEAAFPEMNGVTLKVDTKWSAVSLAERDMHDN